MRTPKFKLKAPQAPKSKWEGPSSRLPAPSPDAAKQAEARFLACSLQVHGGCRRRGDASPQSKKESGSFTASRAVSVLAVREPHSQGLVSPGADMKVNRILCRNLVHETWHC